MDLYFDPFTQHLGCSRAVIPSSKPGLKGTTMRGIPPSVVDNAIKNGDKVITFDKFGKEAMRHTYDNVHVFTDSKDFSIIVSLRKGVK